MTTSDTILAAADGETAAGTMSQAATTDNDILIALNKLDAENDDNWTSTGKPAMDAVNALLPAPITRARLDEVAPDFSRPETPADDTTAGDVGIEQPAPEVVTKAFEEFPDEGHGTDTIVAEEPQVSVEGRVSDLEADIAFLRKQFGWPTKDD